MGSLNRPCVGINRIDARVRLSDDKHRGTRHPHGVNRTLPGDQNPLGIFHHEHQTIDLTPADAPADADAPNPKQRRRLVLGVVAGVVALCCGGSAIIGALVVSSTSNPKPAAITDGTAADSASPDPTQSDNPEQDREAGVPSTSTAARAAGFIGAPRARTRRGATRSPSASATRSPTAVPSVRASSPVTSPPATTKPPGATGAPTTIGVESGAPCSPAGAVGLTSSGTLMECQSTEADPKPRWRPV
jgi:hypothetical protein